MSGPPKNYDSIVATDHTDVESPAALTIRATLSSDEYKYDVATIKSEFQRYHDMLPKPDALLQQQHSVEILRDMINKQIGSKQQQQQQQQTNKNVMEMPRFLKPESEGGIMPHNALCALLLHDFQEEQIEETAEVRISSWLVWALSFGCLHRQLNLPADFIRDQFNRVAHVIPAELVEPSDLRIKIRHSGLPVPNFFLDPEDAKQFPPHIAMLVILQAGEKESRHLSNNLHRVAWLLFAAVALVLRLVLEVIGGAGAIWGGSEVFHLRHSENSELWRWISIAVGVLCFLRFVTLNAPQQEDEGDILGPAGPWSLRTPARLRAVCEHPFHYFCRAQPPFCPKQKDH